MVVAVICNGGLRGSGRVVKGVHDRISVDHARSLSEKATLLAPTNSGNFVLKRTEERWREQGNTLSDPSRPRNNSEHDNSEQPPFAFPFCVSSILLFYLPFIPSCPISREMGVLSLQRTRTRTRRCRYGTSTFFQMM